MERKVDFIVAGAQKAGTSAIDSYLRCHPDIGMGKVKEIHFFDNEDIFLQSAIDYTTYASSFDFNSNKKIYGEVTPIYMYWEPSCRRIWAYNDSVKLIFVLRNPIDRAYSHWRMIFDRGIEKQNFSWAIRNERKRSRKALPYQLRRYSYLARGYYSEQIRRFRRFFPDDQLFFIKYEDFITDQEQMIYRILDFLEVNIDDYLFEYREKNKSKSKSEISTEDRSYLVDNFKYEIREVERVLGWDCSDWLDPFFE